MSKILSEDEIKMVCQLVEELKKEANADLTIEENMQISLAGRIENIDEQKEAAEICQGIHDFDELLKQLEAEDGRQRIRKALDACELENKTVQEQYERLAESLKALCADLSGKNYGLEEFKNLAIKKEGEITEEDLNKLKDLTAEYIDQFALLHEEAEAMEAFFQFVGASVPDVSMNVFEDETEKYYIALAVYILNQQGKIDYIPPEMGARWAGVNASACAASAKARAEGILGKISWEEVKEKLKKIASAVITLLVVIAAGAVVIKTGQIVFVLTTAIFGYHAIGIVTAVVLMAVTQLKLIEMLSALWENIQESAGQLKDVVKEKGEEARESAERGAESVKNWVEEEAVPALKSFWEKTKETVSGFVHPVSNEKETEEEVEDEYEAEEDIIDAAVEA